MSLLKYEYDQDEGIDYAIGEEDNANYILDELQLSNYDDIEKRLNQPEMDALKIRNYLKREIKKSRSPINGSKSQISQAYKQGKISDSEKTINFKRLDNVRGVLNQYIQYYEQNVKSIKGSGVRRKQKGGNVVFYNDPKELLKRLELIIGSRHAGNTSIQMHNTGVAILDMLLRTSTINKAQHEKLYKNYFQS